MSEEKCAANSKETCEIVVSEPYKPEDQEKQIIRSMRTMLTVTFVLSGISIILLLLPIASTIKLMNNSSDLKEKDIIQELHDDSIQVEVPMVVLIAGGCINVIKDRDGISDYPSSSYAEFWSYDGNHCSLPNMISTRNEHYQAGELVCGGLGKSMEQGFGAGQTCERFVNGSWQISHILNKTRYQHVMWKSSKGVILIGGNKQFNTTELLKDDGSSNYLFPVDYVRESCSIELNDSVILTGGGGFRARDYEGYYNPQELVRQYYLNGTEKSLPSLNEGRKSHACGSFTNNKNQRVLIVVGGNGAYSTTEILIMGSDQWQFMKPLPYEFGVVRGATLNNDFFVFGGNKFRDDFDVHNVSDEIYKFTLKEWKLVGYMKQRRALHSLSLVPYDNVKDFGFNCTKVDRDTPSKVISVTSSEVNESNNSNSSIVPDLSQMVALITGGENRDRDRWRNHQRLNSTEVWSPDFQCLLPPMTDKRDSHSQSGNLVCGGSWTPRTCEKLEKGSWRETHNITSRSHHMMWNSSIGVILIGGIYGDGETTTELLKDDGTSEKLITVEFTQSACVIEIEEAMIITGGDAHGGAFADTTRVVQYDVNGNKTYLPSLNSKRSDHACGSFMNSENKRVLIVVGGSPLSSTEILIDGNDAWQYKKRLPFDIKEFGGATINNEFYVFGGELDHDAFGNVLEPSDEIYKFNAESEVWELAG